MIVLLAGFLAAASSAAPRDSVVVLPEVRVERARPRTGVLRSAPTAFVTEIPVGRGARAFETLPDLLHQAAGVRVVQYGGLGAFSTLSLRGAPPGQVALYLDGVPLTSAAHGVVSLADLPLGALDRIEVYRGTAPLSLGPALPGGAVNLVSSADPSVRSLRVARGSFGTWEGRGTAGFARGRTSLLVHAGYQGSEGDFRYADDNGTPLNPADDSTSVRVNNRFDAASAVATLAWRPAPGLRLALREDAFQKAQGLPGLGAVPALGTRLGFSRSVTALEIEREGGEGPGSPEVRLHAALDRERSEFRDTRLPDRGELGLGRHDTEDRLASDDVALAIAWPRLLPALGPLPPFGLEVAGSLRRETARSADAADPWPDPPASRRDASGVSIGLDVEPCDALLLRAARRWDRLVDHLRSVGVGGAELATDVARELDTPQLGARVRGPVGLEGRANWTDASRAPDFLELFGNQGSVLGNPQLRPERGESWDAGLSWRGRPLGRLAAFEWAHFDRRTRDLVLYVRNSASTVRATNVLEARVRGEEWSGHLALAPGLSLAGSATWQSALQTGSHPAFWRGRRLPTRPSRQAWGRLEGARGPVTLALEALHIGDNYLDFANRQRVPSRTLLSAALACAVRPLGLRVTLEGRNLGDRRAADVGGFPLPGRTLFVSFDLRVPSPTGGSAP